jgi:hypothetical protein
VRRWCDWQLEFAKKGLTMKRGDELGQIRSVKTTAKRRAKSEAELLDQATNNLARS